MKKSKFTDNQIIKPLKENEAGWSVEEIRREFSMNKGTFYDWRNKYEGVGVSHLNRLKELDKMTLHSKFTKMAAVGNVGTII